MKMNDSVPVRATIPQNGHANLNSCPECHELYYHSNTCSIAVHDAWMIQNNPNNWAWLLFRRDEHLPSEARRGASEIRSRVHDKWKNNLMMRIDEQRFVPITIKTRLLPELETLEEEIRKRLHATLHATRKFVQNPPTTVTYPRMTVDEVTGAIYVYVKAGEIAFTETYRSDIVHSDHDKNGVLLGVEILPFEGV